MQSRSKLKLNVSSIWLQFNGTFIFILHFIQSNSLLAGKWTSQLGGKSWEKCFINVDWINKLRRCFSFIKFKRATQIKHVGKSFQLKRIWKDENFREEFSASTEKEKVRMNESLQCDICLTWTCMITLNSIKFISKIYNEINWWIICMCDMCEK